MDQTLGDMPLRGRFTHNQRRGRRHRELPPLIDLSNDANKGTVHKAPGGIEQLTTADMGRFIAGTPRYIPSTN